MKADILLLSLAQNGEQSPSCPGCITPCTQQVGWMDWPQKWSECFKKEKNPFGLCKTELKIVRYLAHSLVLKQITLSQLHQVLSCWSHYLKSLQYLIF